MQCSSALSTASFELGVLGSSSFQPACMLAVELPRVVGHLHAMRSHAQPCKRVVLCRDVLYRCVV